jgi:hypothetical protein
MRSSLTLHLLTLAAAYCDRTGTAVSTLSQRAANDWRFLDRVREGRLDFRIGTYDRVVGWLSANWPVDLPWPEDVPRPEVCVVEEEV